MRIALSALVWITSCDQVYGLPDRPERIDANVDAVDAPCVLGAFNGAEVFPITGFPAGTFDPAICHTTE